MSREMTLSDLQLYCDLKYVAVDFKVDGRVYQVSGVRGMRGLFERFFPQNNHPYRRNAGRDEVEAALARAQWFRTWGRPGQHWQGVRRSEFTSRVVATLPGS